MLGAGTGLVVRAIVLLPPSRQFGLAALATVRDEQAGVRDDWGSADGVLRVELPRPALVALTTPVSGLVDARRGCRSPPGD